MKLAESLSEEQLFTKGMYPWVGGSVLGSYFVSCLSSHYDWAMKKLKNKKMKFRCDGLELSEAISVVSKAISNKTTSQILEGIKEYMRYMAAMGYNQLQLYLEDMYEMPEKYKHFGYMRGRYSTEELKEMENTIFSADEKLVSLEYQIFDSLRALVEDNRERIRKSAALIAEIDVYRSLAEVASKNNYVCPEVDLSTEIIIKDGRHPVVEKFVTDSYFVPNDTHLDMKNSRLMIITGPNMAGKSTYMRQVAIISIMMQIGSYVPASAADICVVDRVFTRVGASDDLASGQSTFMLEMNEVSYILKNATKKRKAKI